MPSIRAKFCLLAFMLSFILLPLSLSRLPVAAAVVGVANNLEELFDCLDRKTLLVFP